jgi:hypothetical protein
VRLAAIIVVVVGHWLDTTIPVVDGLPAGQSALHAVSYMRWLTLPLQVKPLFFLGGGYAAAESWQGPTSRGEPFSTTGPPNLALMAYSAAYIGAALLLGPLFLRGLQRPRVWAWAIRGNSIVMTLFLWHMIPVVVAAALLSGVVALVSRFERPRPATPGRSRRAPAGRLRPATHGRSRPSGRGPAGARAPRSRGGALASFLLVGSLALTGVALSQLALGGVRAVRRVASRHAGPVRPRDARAVGSRSRSLRDRVAAQRQSGR